MREVTLEKQASAREVIQEVLASLEAKVGAQQPFRSAHSQATPSPSRSQPLSNCSNFVSFFVSS